MRKVLIITLGLASLGAIAAAQPAAAGCIDVCVKGGRHCLQTKKVCSVVAPGGAQQPIQQQKLKKQF